ncbi:flagellar protein FlaG [Tistrella mobilis]|uniref:Flagellar protein FlaG n=1 Tax=Tistrella mobilis (strain KA081020-065) TaxID=1110502 RepID=I3TJH7_TISMK|nr:flagellar protein FlaG [Tistrella mobilis]AFK52915.1 flagellar protein FlaG [Tistrella mobilis KA081020-065]|tara:strand:- start:10 stop:432 length:423 start_codon:yes stop_codon:yes gene_type:complete
MDIASVRGSSYVQTVTDRPATNARSGSGGGGEAAAAAGYARAATIEPFRRVDVTQAEDQSSGSKAAEALAKALREQGIDLGSMASQVKLALDIDTNTGDVVGRIVDRSTGEVVEQLPPEKTLRMIAALREMVGAVVDRTL